TIARLQEIRSHITELALRRTTLRPGESIRGELEFPEVRSKLPVTFVIPVGREEFRFRFRPRWDETPHASGWPRVVQGLTFQLSLTSDGRDGRRILRFISRPFGEAHHSSRTVR